MNKNGCSHWEYKKYADALKQLYRRGENKAFVTHRKGFQEMNEID